MSEIFLSIEQGFLKGKIGRNIDGRIYYAFLGIPYAKPPVGELRFKAPQPPDKWTGTLDATKDGNACYSRDFTSRTIVGSEDCLFLNIYTPGVPDVNINPKPVMVYIHGGAFTSGSNNSQIYGPEFLLAEDIVLVVINYRLGLLGFLQSDDPEVGVPGNAGCKDMIMALKWVQSNIIHFEGDPNNVTLFGESAGAAAVHLLMLSPMGKGLFHRAIAQSGSALNPWSLAKPSMEDLLKILKCSHVKSKDVLRYLQELRVEDILEAQDKMQDDFSADFHRYFGPVIEQITPNETPFLCEIPLKIISHGKYNQVPLIMGYNSREGIFFEMLEKKWSRKQVIDNFERMIPHFFKLDKDSDASKSFANKIKKFYFGQEVPSYENIEKSCLVQTDTMFVHGIFNSVRSHILLSSKFPIYFYRFSLDAGLNFYKKTGDLKQPGASHADDLGYLFKTPITPADLQEDSIELKSVRRMTRLWTNFAKTGDPNPIENALWETISRNEEEKIHFLDIDRELTSGINPDQDRMKFWDSIVM